MYIYCLKNRAQVQMCFEGTLFNPLTRQCENAQNVTCQGKAFFFLQANELLITCFFFLFHFGQDATSVTTEQLNESSGSGRSATARKINLEFDGPQITNKSVTCPRRKGLFPFEGNCRKFINCWGGKPHVQICSEGTLFNPITRECDHADKVTCLGMLYFSLHSKQNFLLNF